MWFSENPGLQGRCHFVFFSFQQPIKKGSLCRVHRVNGSVGNVYREVDWKLNKYKINRITDLLWIKPFKWLNPTHNHCSYMLALFVLGVNDFNEVCVCRGLVWCIWLTFFFTTRYHVSLIILKSTATCLYVAKTANSLHTKSHLNVVSQPCNCRSR